MRVRSAGRVRRGRKVRSFRMSATVADVRARSHQPAHARAASLCEYNEVHNTFLNSLLTEWNKSDFIKS